MFKIFRKKIFTFDSMINSTKLSISQQKSSLKAIELVAQTQKKSFNESINEIQRFIKVYMNQEARSMS